MDDTLIELELWIASPDAEGFPARYTLRRLTPYPAAPEIAGDRLVPRSHTQVLAQADGRLPADRARWLMVPSDPWASLQVGTREFTEATYVSQRMPELGLALLREGAPELFDRFLRERQGAGDGRAARLTMLVDPVQLRDAPWELMWDEQFGNERWRAPLVVRRMALPAGSDSRAFDLPLNIAVQFLSRGAGESPVDALFDDMGRFARDRGAVAWRAVSEPDPRSEIVHLVYDSSGGIEPVTRALEAQTSPWPRLLVLHDAGPAIPAVLAAPLLYRSLVSGADAVLLAATGRPEPDALGFFPRFYRHMMHNLPLDACLALAIEESGRAGNPLPATALALRSGGEHCVLLSNAIDRRLQEVAMMPGEPEKPAVRTGEEAGAGRVEGSAGGGRGEVGSAPVDRRSARASRARRAADDLSRHAQAAARDGHRDVVEAAAGVSGMRFDAESHAVEVMVGTRDEVSRRAGSARRVARMAEAIEARAAREPEEVAHASVRLTNLWLTTGPGQLVTEGPLIKDVAYELNLKIDSAIGGALAADPFPEEALREAFAGREEVLLDVQLFSPGTEFAISAPRGQIRLPRAGPSSQFVSTILPLRTGRLRVRAAIYYRNVMLQTMLLEASVVLRGRSPAVSGETDALIARTVDYVASTDLALLDELPSPTVNIFTNRGPAGDHWVGVFGDAGAMRLQPGSMTTLTSRQIDRIGKPLRTTLREVEGKRSYRFAGALPLDANGRLKVREPSVAARAPLLIELAKLGWTAFHQLFLLEEGGGFDATLADSGLVSIARCNAEDTTLPWAALYALPLDTGAEDAQLCPVTLDALARNRWQGDVIVEPHDLLNDPAACRAQECCPLKGPDARRTVCPLGFWGYLHQIEQPLQQVERVSNAAVPKELADPDFNQTSFIIRHRGEAPRVAMGAFAETRLETVQHHAELAALAQEMGATLEYQEERSKVMGLVEAGGQHCYYFYCHGESDSGIFRLKVGNAARKGYIAAADLFGIKWPAGSQPLVMLNGCRTVALIPEEISGMLASLRRLGASGVVGTEIEVFPGLARPFGRDLLRRVVAGESMGEALLAIRRHLLRQLNPLGLAYTVHAPAALHLHDPEPGACAWCSTHDAGV